MTVADALVAGNAPFWTQEWEDYLRAVGGMFAELESYAADPDEPDVEFFVYRPNYAANPDFERDNLATAPAGWGAPVVSGGAVDEFLVVGDWSARNAHSLRMRATSVPVFDAIKTSTDPIPVTVADPWRLAATFNVISPNTQGFVQLDFFDAVGAFIQSVGTTFTPTGAGESRINTPHVPVPLLAVTMKATVGFRNATGVTATVDGYVDAVVQQQGWPIPSPPFSGDDEGHEWAGIPGNSTSVQSAPVPQVGWSKMLDVERADTKGLPYLAQWVGERFPVGLTDAAQREWIRRSPNQWRGTMQSIADGIFPFLTGFQSVYMRERSKIDLTSDPDWLAILTFASETPNPTVVYNQLRRKLVDASINIDYAAVSRETWTAIEAGRTWTGVEAGSPTWSALEALQPGYVPPGFTLWTPSS